MENEKLKIEESAIKIRNFFNDSIVKKTSVFLKKKSGDWDQFFAALDTIEDTCLAIQNFQKDPDDFFIKNPYLATYGILQALFIQQDAVNYLKISLFGSDKKIDWGNTKYTELAKIRQMRNETVGHPVKTNRNGRNSTYTNDEITSCTINRSSLTKDGFCYMLWMHSRTESKKIKFPEIIDLQDKYLSVELVIVMKQLQREERQHKVKFKGEKLVELLNKKSLYEINQIYGFQWGDHLAWSSFDYYHELYKKIRKGLEDRYGKFGETIRIPGTHEVIKKLDFIFSKIEVFKNTQKFENYELEVYIDVLDAGLEELKTHLIETDKAFEI